MPNFNSGISTAFNLGRALENRGLLAVLVASTAGHNDRQAQF